MAEVLYESHGNVRLITIDRAKVMNSMDFAANEEMVEIWRAFAADDSARVAVITGSGDKAFCAGADLKTYTQPFASTPSAEFRRRYTNGPGFGGITRNLDIPKPIVAAVNGFAVSGGFELALAADIRFAAPHAKFGLQDAKWGFHACDGGLIRLPQIVGLGHAMEMILSGDLIDADHALRIGLVNRVLPAEKLLEESLAYAEKLARRSPLSHRLAKEVMQQAIGMPMVDALKLESRSFRDVGDSEDLREGLAAFKEKREAEFTGR